MSGRSFRVVMTRIRRVVKIMTLSTLVASAAFISLRHSRYQATMERIRTAIETAAGRFGPAYLLSVRWHRDKECDATKTKLPCPVKISANFELDNEDKQPRAKTVRKICLDKGVFSLDKERLSGVGLAFMKPRHFDNFIVDDANRVIYCHVPRAGSSQWKAVMAVLGGSLRNPEKYHYVNVHQVNTMAGSPLHDSSFFRKLSDYTMEEIMERIENRSYQIFTFVRHPVARVLSAHKEKFALSNTMERPKYDRYYGNYIFDKYQGKNVSEAEIGYKISWQAFARYLADPMISDLDEHWNLQYTLCNPCQIRFNFIGKVEESEAEAPVWIDRLVTSLRNSSDGLRNAKRWKSLRLAAARPNEVDEKLVRMYFSKLPDEVRRGLYNRYKLDMMLFDYDPYFR